MNTLYRRQAALLVKTIPYIAREPSFAIKGGTAINLFYRDLPRLSVDIDLVYLGFEPRDEAILLIEAALERVAQALKAAGLGAVVQGSLGSRKLLVSDTATVIKVDMSTVFTKEFQGMTDQAFSYDDHRQTLHRLLGFVSEGLTPFKSAIIDFFSLMPTSITTLPSDFNRLPAIQWKRQNLIKLRTDNPGKFEAQVERIKHCFKS